MTGNNTESYQQLNLDNWQPEVDADGVLWVGINKANDSANVLSGPVLRELDTLLGKIEADRPAGVVFFSGKPGMFIMGADINEFTRIGSTDEAYELISQGQQVIDRIEALPVPSVAAIDGFALGGGLELALACDYRLVLENDKPILGLPEVQLGIHPGFGGTVRAVNLIGARAAIPLMLTGKSWRPGKALKAGLVDRLATADDWRGQAVALIKTRPAKRRAPFVDRLLNLAPLRRPVAAKMEQEVARKARRKHYPAPYAIVELWRRYGANGRSAYSAEAQSIARLMCNDTSRNLVRVFFLQNSLKRQGGKPERDIEKVHVVGAGVMGGDIAAWCALRGLTVTLQDREEKYVLPALERASKLFKKRLKTEEQIKAASERLKADVPGDGAAEADLVIEAIFENKDAKQSLYASLEPRMQPHAVLATNTSSIRLEELRTQLRRPERLIGLHFFNPVAQLPLVEVIRADGSSRQALDIGHGFVKKIGKTPLECRSAPGFLVNRILAPYMAEAMYLAESGTELAVIDEEAVRFGMPMGPVELADSVGLDVALHVSKILADAYGYPVSDTLVEMVEAGKTGRKSGQGFYRWVEGRAQKPAASEQPATEDLRDRLILPMVNEAVACLNDGVVSDADLLDAGVIFGTGFAPFRGGPLNYARTRGLYEVRNRLEWLANQYGERFAPKNGWDTLIDNS